MPTNQNTPRRRRATGSLKNISARQLAKRKAKACADLDAQWRRDNQASTRSRGRPSDKDHVVAACTHIQREMLGREPLLTDWYKAVDHHLKSQSTVLSKPTITKFTREWLIATLPLDVLPEGIGSYLINSRPNFKRTQLLFVWTRLCKEHPVVQAWLIDYVRKTGAFPSELPHEILPPTLQDKVNPRLIFPLGPRYYDRLIRDLLRESQRLALRRYLCAVLRAVLSTRTEK
jgi:hypothetical protein